MSTTWHLFRYETLKAFRDKTLPFILVLTSGLTFLSVYAGDQWLEFIRDTQKKIKQSQQEQLSANIGDLRAHEKRTDTTTMESPANPAILYSGKRAFALKPLSPLMVLCVGQSDLHISYSAFTGVYDHLLLFENEIVNPINLMLGKPDWHFLLTFLLPLFIIALCFNIYPQESELGTLKLLLTQHVPLKKFLWTKVVVRFTIFTLAFLLSTIIALIIFEPVVLTGYSGYTLLFFAVAIIYCGFWFVICYLVNIFKKDSVFNGLVLSATWLTMLFVVPSFILSYVTFQWPVSSNNTHILDLKQQINTINRDTVLARKYAGFPHYKEASAKVNAKLIMPAWYTGFLAWQENAFYMEETTQHKAISQLLKQEKFLEKCAYFVPPFFSAHVFQKLSASGLPDFIEYNNQVTDFKKEWRQFLSDKIYLKTPLNINDFYRFPKFTYSPLPVSLYTILMLSGVWLLTCIILYFLAVKILR